MTYQQDTESVEDSDAREGVEFAYGLVRHRVAFGRRTVTIDGQSYTAFPSQREDLRVSAVADDGELVITLPVTHPMVQRWMAGAVPPRNVSVTVVRKETRSGETQTLYRGAIDSVALEGDVAHVHCPARISQDTARGVPSVTVGRQCPHVLYGSACGVSRATHVQSATVVSYEGAKIRLSISPSTDFTGGEIEHVASEQRMTIAQHVGAYFTAQLPFYGLAIGDAIEVVPGCPHIVSACQSLYNNVLNFGGFPALPSKSIVREHGIGVFERED